MASHRPKLAALVLTVVAGTVLAAGCGGGGEQARSASQLPASNGGGNGSNTVSNNAQKGRSSDGSSSIRQQSNGDANSSVSQQSSSSNGGTSTFSGSGATTLSFDVQQPSRLAWTNSEGKPFTADGGGISIDSSSGHGETQLRPGTYENVRIEGADWTIVVRPR